MKKKNFVGSDARIMMMAHGLEREHDCRYWDTFSVPHTNHVYSAVPLYQDEFIVGYEVYEQWGQEAPDEYTIIDLDLLSRQ